MSAIIQSESGCVTELHNGLATFSTIDIRSGFQFFAAHDPIAGCEATIQNPTNGLHFITITPTEYTVNIPELTLPKCGRVQFDAHGYGPNGLDPLALYSFIYNSGISCNSQGIPNGPKIPFNEIRTGETPKESILVPENPPNNPPGNPPIVNVPDISSTFVLLLIVIVFLLRIK